MLNRNDNSDIDENENILDNYTGRGLVLKYLKNIKNRDTFDVRYRHDACGQMLIDEGIITASRLFAYSSTYAYPYSVTQLPKVIKGMHSVGISKKTTILLLSIALLFQ